MRPNIKSILDLSITLAKSEFKLRYEGSYLGIFWYLLNPLFLFALLFAVFHDRLGQKVENYPLYLLLGIIMFNLFQHATTESIKIIQGKRHLIKSINFPRETLVGSTVLKFLFSHAFEVGLFILFMIIFGVSPAGILFYPLILALFALFVFGVSLALFSIAFYLADLENIWLFTSRLLWFATPIFYSIGGQKRLFLLNLFNPVYYFITATRDVVVYTRMPQSWILLGMVGYTLISLLVGLGIFYKLKGKFAEMI